MGRHPRKKQMTHDKAIKKPFFIHNQEILTNCIALNPFTPRLTTTCTPTLTHTHTLKPAVQTSNQFPNAPTHPIYRIIPSLPFPLFNTPHLHNHPLIHPFPMPSVIIEFRRISFT